MTFGYPAASPAGVLALRALARHGYRAVLASGRSLTEVRERCVDLRLTAGVAEYGGALYHIGAPSGRSLLDTQAETRRAALAAWPGWAAAELDESYRHVVRAFRIMADGGHRRIDDVLLGRAIEETRGQMTAVIGMSQVDFVPDGVDKATGMLALLATMGHGEGLEMAVGDHLADLPLLRLARRPFVPANGAAELGHQGLRMLRRPTQAGLLEAVGQLIGHRPGGCPVCRIPAVDPGRRVLLTVLGAEDRSRAGKLLQAALLDLGVRR
jgi:hydroxymethylpyrimidine pyrophosphatase-like HAD family hydrolase